MERYIYSQYKNSLHGGSLHVPPCRWRIGTSSLLELCNVHHPFLSLYELLFNTSLLYVHISVSLCYTCSPFYDSFQWHGSVHVLSAVWWTEWEFCCVSCYFSQQLTNKTSGFTYHLLFFWDFKEWFLGLSVNLLPQPGMISLEKYVSVVVYIYDLIITYFIKMFLSVYCLTWEHNVRR